MRTSLSIHNYRGDSSNLQTCTTTYLFRNCSRQQLEKYFKERVNKGLDMFWTKIEEFDEEEG